MNGRKSVMEVSRRVYDGNEGASVLITPGEDGFGVMIMTGSDVVSKEWFGDNRITFTPEVARSVAEALLRCADEVDPLIKP